MTNVHSRHTSGLEAFAILALAITFLLRYAPFLASHLLFGPFQRQCPYLWAHIRRGVEVCPCLELFRPIFPIRDGFSAIRDPPFLHSLPVLFSWDDQLRGAAEPFYTLTYLTLLHIFIFYVNLYVLLRCGTVPPWAAYIGASVGMLARNTELYASWITITASYAWLPLVSLAGCCYSDFLGRPME